ncbi:MAG: WbuC family cupin fold metalloprotein [Thiocapsa sp.]|jgi:cupin fold WbuC family metalloprotein|nr:WbuC family cupin fold metalloprotein [Thiocapsa sp.]MCG6897244.1 WbuC family cupin fold metalloprotein [Thiocapsa sp.]MCG6983992.1 WbuC family cupin fold metalloprotein [Thiocapsa sp.]
MKIINTALFDDLCERALASPRRRAHHLIHDSHGESVQRILIAMQPGTYVRPHRHRRPPKWELILVLKGIAAWIGFDEQGRVTGRTEAGADQDCTGLECPQGTWHSLICLRPDTLVFECKPGPFSPVQAEDFARWAPEEGALDAADCVRWMVRARVGERFRGSDGSRLGWT